MITDHSSLQRGLIPKMQQNAQAQAVMRILIVDDSEDSRDLTKAALLSAGYTDVVTAPSAADAYKILGIDKGVDGAPVLTGLKRSSTPGRRIYSGYADIPRVLNGLGIAIISTSKGLMKDQDARRHKLGGELVCTVW